MYKQPPITEAVIGINFAQQMTNAELAILQSKLSKYYPNQEPLNTVNLKFELRNGVDGNKQANAGIESEESGLRLSTSDMTELLIIFPGSFAISQLAPYPGWDCFYQRFARDWKILKREAGFQPIQRVGVRYINRIDIPFSGPIVQHEQYLGIYPNITDKYGPLTAYSVQAEVFMADLDCKLLINTAAVPSPILNHASFVVDQDISKETNVPQKDEDLFSLLEIIRTRKNEVFESCITDQARALFKHDV